MKLAVLALALLGCATDVPPAETSLAGNTLVDGLYAVEWHRTACADDCSTAALMQTQRMVIDGATATFDESIMIAISRPSPACIELAAGADRDAADLCVDDVRVDLVAGDVTSTSGQAWCIVGQRALP